MKAALHCGVALGEWVAYIIPLERMGKHGQDIIKTFNLIHSLCLGKFFPGTFPEETILNTERALCIKMLTIGLLIFKTPKGILVMYIMV